MLFTLKKLLGTLLSPVAGGMLFLLVALALTFTRRFRRVGRILLAVGLVVFYLLGLSPVANALIAPLEGAHPAVLDPAAVTLPPRWILVLGGGHAGRADQPARPASVWGELREGRAGGA